MVRADFRLLTAESSLVKYSSLGSLCPAQSSLAFPLHPLLEELLYADWQHKHNIPIRFFILHPMEEKFLKNWCMPAVDAAVSSFNKNLTYLTDNVQVSKDPAYKRLETQLKPYFALAGSAMQQAVEAIGICQVLRIASSG